MAKFIETDFTKELSKLLNKHKKTIESDKSGIYIVDSEAGGSVIISRQTLGSEDSRDKIYFVTDVYLDIADFPTEYQKI